MDTTRHLKLYLAVLTALLLTFVLLTLVSRHTPTARAAPGIYYVLEGSTGSCTAPTDPCGLIIEALKLATSPGDQVWVAGGTYTENLLISYGVTLLGGWDPSFTVRSPISYPTVVNGGGNHIVEVTVGEGAAVLDGFIFRNGRDGLHIYAGAITITNNIIREVTRQGIEIERGRVWLVGNLITAIDREGIEIDGGTVVVRANRVYTTGRHAILVESGTTLIEDNIIRNVVPDPLADYHGINILTGTHVISGNQLSTIDDRGIQVEAGRSTIVGNLIQGTGGDGIRTGVASTYAEIRDNIVRNAGNDGIDARGLYITVAGNTVRSPADRGINGENGVLNILGNLVYNAGGDGIRTASSATRVTVSGNAVYTAENDGMDVRGHYISISRNTVQGSFDNGIRAEGSKTVHIQANRIFSSGTGLAIRGSPLFTVTNNFVGQSITASIELSGTSRGYVYHNTFVGGVKAAQGVGLYILTPLTLTFYNNIVAGHQVGLISSRGVRLEAARTLLWDNKDGAVFGSDPIVASPRFVDPGGQDYHLLPGSPAIDAGADVGVRDDIDGHRRPIGRAPDIGADEFEAALSLSKYTTPAWAQTGRPLSYTVLVTNTGGVTLTATITDKLPAGVSPPGVRVWTAEIPASGVWSTTFTVTVNPAHTGPLINVVRATSDKGASDSFTHTLSPRLAVVKLATPPVVRLGMPLSYTILVTNTGDFVLHAVITDELPAGVSPPGQRVWTALIPAPGGVWSTTFAVIVNSDHIGPLVNVVRASSAEGATGSFTHTLAPALSVVKLARPQIVRPGGRIEYTLLVTNTGDFDLHATITDTLPLHITSWEHAGGTGLTPTAPLTWTAFITAPGGVWRETVVITVEADYIGPLTNVVEVSTEEGVEGRYVSVAYAWHAVYLPLVLRGS
ncbi:MAG: right-handed parallel beta-helix repeat-containing protein [Anaerolineae bacterium]|nr:right-handed parallel beta-helix repeat-containing protein [Anaerolineae bacterium]